MTEPKTAIELAKIGNDELAELVAKYPDRFIAAIGNLPMNDMDAALGELDRIVNELNFRGIQICTDINGKALDAPEFMPLYEKMEKYDLPILLHPARPASIPDYTTESTSKYKIHHIIGWPYDTSAAMIRLVLSHVLLKYPNIKFVTHHCGAMIPYFGKRILTFLNDPDMKYCTQELKKPPLEYFKMFYADTAVSGSTPALMCGYAFFGADHILFGTDMPYGTASHKSRSLVDETIESIEQMDIKGAEKEKIFSGNAVKLLRLKV
jgi:aminocarboxymuconate-semialdehyde decarboxylase